MDKTEALEYLNQARFFLGAEQYEDGIDSINKAIALDRMNIELYIYKSIFLANLERFDEAYEQGLIYRIMTTNSIYQSPELLQREWYINVDITKFTATFIDRLNHDASISDLLNPIEKINKKVAEYNKR